MGEALDKLLKAEEDSFLSHQSWEDAYQEYCNSAEAIEFLQNTDNMCNGSCRTSPICDNCSYFWFSMDWCGYPGHPGQSFPHDLCDDYECQFVDVESFIQPPWWRGYWLKFLNSYLEIKYRITRKY